MAVDQRALDAGQQLVRALVLRALGAHDRKMCIGREVAQLPLGQQRLDEGAIAFRNEAHQPRMSRVEGLHQHFARALGTPRTARHLDQHLARALEALAQRLGSVKAPRSMAELFPEQACVLCTWAELDHFDRPGEPAYVGPVWGDLAQGPQAGFKRAEGEGPKVLAYLNLIDKRYDLLWQALTAAGADVLVLSPGGTPWAHEAARGWGVEVVDHPVGLAPLLAQADAVVNHGGMATCSMALLAGKPLLVLPQNAEQGILAHRLARRGLATATVRLRDKANLRQRVTTLLDGSPREPVAALAARYSGYTPAAAIDAIVQKLAAF